MILRCLLIRNKLSNIALSVLAGDSRLEPTKPSVFLFEQSIEHFLRPLFEPLVESLGVELNECVRLRLILEDKISSCSIGSVGLSRFLNLMDLN